MNKHEFVRSYFKMTDDAVVDKMAECLTKKTYKKGDFLYQSGEIINEIPFLIKGTAIEYKLTEEGDKSIIGIACHPGHALVSDYNWVTQSPTRYCCEAAGKLETYVIAMNDIEAIRSHFPEAVSSIAVMYLQKSQETQLENFIIMGRPGVKRIQWFYANYPEACLREEDIAAFLKMSRENYSRTRRKLPLQSVQGDIEV